MKKFLLAFSFLVIFITINSCRQDDAVLSNEDITNLRIIQDTRTNRDSKSQKNKKDSTMTMSITFKQEEIIIPPKK